MMDKGIYKKSDENCSQSSESKMKSRSSFFSNKSRWDIAWIIFQMLAVLTAAAWSFTRWGLKDASELLPQYNASINSVESNWFSSEEEGCSFTTAWFLNNKGKTPLEVIGINIKVYAFPEITKIPKGKQYINLSSSERKIEENIIIRELLSPSKDDISANGTISRSISFAYFPEEGIDWFNRNQIGLFVTAKLKQKGSWKELETSEVLAGPIYVCSEKKSKNLK